MAVRIDKAGGITAAAGEVLAFSLVITDELGVAEPMVGRSIEAAVFDLSTGEAVGTATGTPGLRGDLPAMFFGISGDGTRAATGADRQFGVRIAEALDDGEYEWVRRPFRALAAPAAPVPMPASGAGSQQIVQVTVPREDPLAITVEVAGGRGASAAEQLFTAGVIDAPTTAAMQAWIVGLSNGLAGASQIAIDGPDISDVATGPGSRAAWQVPSLATDIGGDFFKLHRILKPDLLAGSDQTPEFRKIMAWLRSEALAWRPRKLVSKRGVYQTVDDFIVDWHGFEFEGDSDLTVIDQATAGRGGFLIFGDRARVGGCKLQRSYARLKQGGSFAGFSGFHRDALVTLFGSYALLEGLHGDNSQDVVCLRGPYRRRNPGILPDGTRQIDAQGMLLPFPIDAQGNPFLADGAASLDFSPMAIGNTVRGLVARNCDFAWTGSHQDDLFIEVDAQNGTYAQLIPTHANGYSRPGAQGDPIYGGKNGRVKIVARGRDNPYTQDIKMESTDSLTIDYEGYRVAGGVSANICGEVTLKIDVRQIVSTLFGTDDATDDNLPYAAIFTSTDFADVSGGMVTAQAGSNYSGIAFRSGAAASLGSKSTNGRIHDITLIDNNVAFKPDGTTPLAAGTPIRVQGNSTFAATAEISDIRRITKAGGIKKALIIGGNAGDTIIIDDTISQTGNNLFVDGKGTFLGNFDQAKVGDGGQPAIDRINTNFLAQPTRRRTDRFTVLVPNPVAGQLYDFDPRVWLANKVVILAVVAGTSAGSATVRAALDGLDIGLGSINAAGARTRSVYAQPKIADGSVNTGLLQLLVPTVAGATGLFVSFECEVIL